MGSPVIYLVRWSFYKNINTEDMFLIFMYRPLLFCYLINFIHTSMIVYASLLKEVVILVLKLYVEIDKKLFFKTNYQVRFPRTISDDARDLLGSLLIKDPLARYTSLFHLISCQNAAIKMRKMPNHIMCFFPVNFYQNVVVR